MNVLAFDPSTKTGWVGLTSKNGGVQLLDTGVVKLAGLKGTARMEYLYNQSQTIFNNVKPHLVVIEGYAHSSFGAATTMVEVGTIIRFALRDTVPMVEVKPTSLKKFVTGAGNVSKDKIMLEVYKRWGFEGTDDQCDAYGLAMFGLSLFDVLDMPNKNMEAVEAWFASKENQEVLSAINCTKPFDKLKQQDQN